LKRAGRGLTLSATTGGVDASGAEIGYVARAARRARHNPFVLHLGASIATRGHAPLDISAITWTGWTRRRCW
jgi:hypothetical protein